MIIYPMKLYKPCLYCGREVTFGSEGAFHHCRGLTTATTQEVNRIREQFDLLKSENLQLKRDDLTAVYKKEAIELFHKKVESIYCSYTARRGRTYIEVTSDTENGFAAEYFFHKELKIPFIEDVYGEFGNWWFKLIYHDLAIMMTPAEVKAFSGLDSLIESLERVRNNERNYSEYFLLMKMDDTYYYPEFFGNRKETFEKYNIKEDRI
jgi:hypothetical protein